jgi:hypothetical protein
MLTVRKQQMKDMGSSSPGQKAVEPCADNRSWIEIRLIDDDGNPVPKARYRLRLPDESVTEGCLDDAGQMRLDNIVPGTCTVEFPDYDRRECRSA